MWCCHTHNPYRDSRLTFLLQVGLPFLCLLVMCQVVLRCAAAAASASAAAAVVTVNVDVIVVAIVADVLPQVCLQTLMQMHT